MEEKWAKLKHNELIKNHPNSAHNIPE